LWCSLLNKIIFRNYKSIRYFLVFVLMKTDIVSRFFNFFKYGRLRSPKKCRLFESMIIYIYFFIYKLYVYTLRHCITGIKLIHSLKGRYGITMTCRGMDSRWRFCAVRTISPYTSCLEINEQKLFRAQLLKHINIIIRECCEP